MFRAAQFVRSVFDEKFVIRSASVKSLTGVAEVAHKQVKNR